MDVTRIDNPNESDAPTPLKRTFRLVFDFKSEEEVLALYLIFNHYTLTESKFIKPLPNQKIRDALGEQAAGKAQVVWSEFLETLGHSIV